MRSFANVQTGHQFGLISIKPPERSVLSFVTKGSPEIYTIVRYYMSETDLKPTRTWGIMTAFHIMKHLLLDKVEGGFIAEDNPRLGRWGLKEMNQKA